MQPDETIAQHQCHVGCSIKNSQIKILGIMLKKETSIELIWSTKLPLYVNVVNTATNTTIDERLENLNTIYN